MIQSSFFHKIIQVFLFLSYLLVLSYSFLSGRIELFLNPRFYFLIYFLLFFFALFSLSLLWNVSKQDWTTYFLFLLPILFFVFSLLFPINYQDIVFTTNVSPVSPIILSNATKDTAFLDFSGGYWYSTFYDTYYHPEQYEGDFINMTGVVYPSEYNNSSSFFLGRLYIWHCLADGYLIGYKVDPIKNQTVIEGEWYKVTGTLILDTLSHNLIINASSIEKINGTRYPVVY